MKKILGRLIIVAPAVIIQILWMNFLYNKLNNSALVTLLLTILAFLFVIYNEAITIIPITKIEITIEIIKYCG